MDEHKVVAFMRIPHLFVHEWLDFLRLCSCQGFNKRSEIDPTPHHTTQLPFVEFTHMPGKRDLTICECVCGCVSVSV